MALNAPKNSNGWCFTLNNYEISDYDLLLSTECQYVIIGKEVSESGTPHLQGFIYFSARKSLKQLKKLHDKCHWEMTKGSIEQNIGYCSKEDRFEERGVAPMSQKKKGEEGKKSIEERWELAKAGRFQELPPEQIKTYEYIFAKCQTVEDRPLLENIWIYGSSGSGKSRYVRDNHAEFYSKPMSKWWDGYNQEDVVVLDDFDPTHGKFLGYFLKIWSDHYAFNAEVKGGMLKIRPKIVIVTSQYQIEDCFEEAETIQAIKRRFKCLQMKHT